jgi:hypothetical protein
MKFLNPFRVSKLTLAIAVCATFILTHTSQGWCAQPNENPSVDCAELFNDLKQAKQLLADLREGMASLLTEQDQYSQKLDYFWDLALERHLTREELEEEARVAKLWLDLQTQIDLLSNDIDNQASLVAVLERDNQKYCTKFAFKKPTATRVREPLI